jgi:hypothetical protein
MIFFNKKRIKKRMRNLIETHLNYCSIESVKSAHRVCEAHLYKGDIFSFGCILYEMSFLKAYKIIYLIVFILVARN